MGTVFGWIGRSAAGPVVDVELVWVKCNGVGGSGCNRGGGCGGERYLSGWVCDRKPYSSPFIPQFTIHPTVHSLFIPKFTIHPTVHH
jgi:hypothetical protein